MTKDHINPDHYRQYPVEAIQVIERMTNPLLANAVKYVWRLGDKDDKEQDRQKALWYVNRFFANAETEYENIARYRAIEEAYLKPLVDVMPADKLRVITLLVFESFCCLTPLVTREALVAAIEAL